MAWGWRGASPRKANPQEGNDWLTLVGTVVYSVDHSTSPLIEVRLEEMRRAEQKDGLERKFPDNPTIITGERLVGVVRHQGSHTFFTMVRDTKERRDKKDETDEVSLAIRPMPDDRPDLFWRGSLGFYTGWFLEIYLPRPEFDRMVEWSRSHPLFLELLLMTRLQLVDVPSRSFWRERIWLSQERMDQVLVRRLTWDAPSREFRKDAQLRLRPRPPLDLRDVLEGIQTQLRSIPVIIAIAAWVLILWLVWRDR